MNACILIIMTHQLHCGGHIIVALRLLRETGSLDQLFPISHLLCSRAVGSHRDRSFLSRTHSVVRERALRTAHSARAESGPAAHVRVERRAKCWRCRFVFFCLSIYFCNAFFPLPALYILQVSTDYFFFPLVFQGAAASVLSIPANRVEGGARTRSISGWRHFLKIATCSAAAHLRSEVCCNVQCSGTARVRAISNYSAFKWSDASVCPKT